MLKNWATLARQIISILHPSLYPRQLSGELSSPLAGDVLTFSLSWLEFSHVTLLSQWEISRSDTNRHCKYAYSPGFAFHASVIAMKKCLEVVCWRLGLLMHSQGSSCHSHQPSSLHQLTTRRPQTWKSSTVQQSHPAVPQMKPDMWAINSNYHMTPKICCWLYNR